MDPTALSATDLAALIARGGIAPSEVMAACLARIARLNPKFNAIVSLRDPEALMAEARALDGKSPTGPLFGLPMAVKDMVATAGIRTTRGSPRFARHVPDTDEMLAARLRAAGAILIGKTNTPEAGLGSHTFNPVFGPTRNPYDLSRTPGGSSGGAAAALAARLVPVADGSDAMGSIRNPAAFCNVYSLRPSFGLIPRDPGGDPLLHRLSTQGPMARHPEDLTLLLDVLAAPDPRWPIHVPRLPDPAPGLKGKRIGWLAGWGGALPFEPGILDLCEAALAEMEAAGATVSPVSPPLSRDALWDAWCALRAFAIASAEAAAYADPAERAQMKPELRWEIETGLPLAAADIAAASATRARLLTAFAELFTRYDALALPSAQVWPFPTHWTYPTDIAGTTMDTYHRWMEVVVPVSLTGLPAIALPAGFGTEGLPMGLHLFGPPGADDRLIGLAAHWHESTGWPARAPSL